MTDQRQHVISEWLLKAFGRPIGARVRLAVYDKATGEYGARHADEFLVELDAHSRDVELEISKIETPASAVARTLAKRAKAYAPGFYAVVDDPSEIVRTGPALVDRGVVAGMRLMVSEHTILGPSGADRAALARYLILMYERAPATEAAMTRFGLAYDRGAQRTIDALLPGMLTGLASFHRSAPARMVERAQRLGDGFAAANWWILRTRATEPFVLSDTPVAATLSLGHDDEWHAILSPEAYAVVMPLGPLVALLMAPKGMLPFSRIEVSDLGRAVDRLMWRAADQYVLGRSRAELEAAVEDGVRRFSVRVPQDEAAIEEEARRRTEGVVYDAMIEIQVWRPVRDAWQHWERCRLRFGHAAFAAEDRDELMSQSTDPRRGRSP
jgi:hypothetical protein